MMFDQCGPVRDQQRLGCLSADAAEDTAPRQAGRKPKRDQAEQENGRGGAPEEHRFIVGSRLTGVSIQGARAGMIKWKIASGTMWACGAVGSALPWHGRGREFESHQVHQNKAQQNIDLRKCLRASTARKRSRGDHLESKLAKIWTPAWQLWMSWLGPPKKSSGLNPRLSCGCLSYRCSSHCWILLLWGVMKSIAWIATGFAASKGI